MLNVYTVVTRNYFHRARVLMADVARHLPEARRIVYLADDPAGLIDGAAEGVEIVPPAAYAPSMYRHFAFMFPANAMCFILKAHASAHMLRQRREDTHLYFDTDMRVYARPTHLLEALQRSAMVVTPHLSYPERNAQTNLDIARSGAFNAGMFGVAPKRGVEEFINWWANQMSDPHRANADFSWDQGWLGLAPAMLDDLHVLRHPGYNVAYWNLHERPLGAIRADGTWEVAGEPLVVYHFSGIDLANPANLAGSLAHQFPLPDPRWSQLGIDYVQRLDAAGAAECTRWGYEFATFRDGKPIQPLHRRYFRQVLWGNLDLAADPFDPSLAAPSSGLRSLYNADHPLTRLYRRLRGKA